MAILKLFMLLSLFYALVVSNVSADHDASSTVDHVVKSDGDDSSSNLMIELVEGLKSKIQSLESHVDLKTQEVKSKDDKILEKEKIIKEKSDTIASLRSEIVSVQKKGTSVVEEQLAKAHARAADLEKQVEDLKKETELRASEKGVLESRVSEAEKKVLEMSSTLKSLKKNINEEKVKIKKTERALQVAEEELMNAKSEATSKIKELTEVHGAWLPPWLAVHVYSCQSYVETQWKMHGKPAMQLVIEKANVKKGQLEKWAEPHVEIVKTKWIPSVKDQWYVVKSNAEPHVQSFSTKCIEVYETSKTVVTPHVIKAHEVVDSYYQEAKKVSKPHIDQVASIAKPHVDKVHGALEPYLKEVVYAYGKFLEYATVYHQEAQGTLEEYFKKHELTRAIATKELVWFAASALLALPFIILFRICSTMFSKKQQKPNRTSNTNHSRRKAKRGHTEKS
ncbi:DNA repair ATPase-related family protein [Heracleum sosnowskyi]|uniref:DNA repair ATPase-related family protein n=1 Tax=Heracleum sosnowskyi TaxID=360622 RepID=A0AAD8HIB3_9APIA|nr:DNA repair ATPase-related family protein [Heracleum sosnowskyi]